MKILGYEECDQDNKLCDIYHFLLLECLCTIILTETFSLFYWTSFNSCIYTFSCVQFAYVESSGAHFMFMASRSTYVFGVN
jgi:hypothetical protein